MMRALVLLACAGAVAGCGAPRAVITPEQRSAIETREIDGAREDVLRAAAAVMLDEGYIYTMSDQEAGLFGGVRLSSPMCADYFARQGGMDSGERLVRGAVVWVRRGGPGRCEMRVQFREQGIIVTDEQQVAAIWTKVQQRMLAYMPARADGAKGGRP